MLSWAVAFLCIALIAAVEGFQQVGGPLASIVLAGTCAGFILAAIAGLLPRRNEHHTERARGTFFEDRTFL